MRKMTPDYEDEFNTTPKEEAPAEEAPQDTTPLIQRLTVAVYHPAGAPEIHADITAVIHAKSGLVTKRTVVSGGLTAKRLSDLLSGLASW